MEKSIHSLGGKARAKSMTSAARSLQASKAARARYSYPKEVHTGVLTIGDILIPCAVLDNDLRVLSIRGVTRAFGGRTQGTSKTGARKVPPFLASEAIKPFIPNDLLARVTSPTEYVQLAPGRTALGFDATLLPDVCRIIMEANRASALRTNQQHLAIAAETLLAGMATVGIIALVDEATGYQDFRAKDALAVILERFIAKELRRWVKTFPDDFYREMFRLKEWEYPPDKGVKYPWVVGKLTNDIVYSRLAPGVLDELRRLTPRNEKGGTKHRYHQRLTADIGHPKLREHLGGVVFAMKLSQTWDEFQQKLDTVAPRFGKNYTLLLEGG